jgi:acetoin utilization deacetylase AcuC-like enzyme
MKVRVFTDPSVTGYAMPGHPEAPERVSRTAEHLAARGWTLERPAVAATEADVRTVHTAEHWNALTAGLFEDPDTPFFDGIDRIALTSLSGCLSAAEAAMSGTPAFSLMRPPGHHAGAERIGGFCYLNNIAIACERYLRRGRRVAVLDVDVHHGDGTESIAQGRDGWLFVSIHQFPLYPGTGLASSGNCMNLPVPPFTGEADYLKVLATALTAIRDFKPDLLAVSAGFDTYKECPIAQLKLEAGTYERIGALIAATGLPRFATLEGGYAAALPQLIERFLIGFGGTGN